MGIAIGKHHELNGNTNTNTICLIDDELIMILK